MNKIEYIMSMNGLSFILSQERKHWLLKTNKKIQVQDKVTGDMFEGIVDNIGSDIIMTASKLPVKMGLSTPLEYVEQAIHNVVEIGSSMLPFNTQYSEMMIARLTSISYPDTPSSYKTFRIKFINAEVIRIPLTSNGKMFSFEWIKTNTPPKIVLSDNTEISMSSNITNGTYFYPLTSSIQPFEVTEVSSGVYTTDAFNDNGDIGYPLYWFTCDESAQGPTLSLESTPNDLLVIGNNGNKYTGELFPYMYETLPDDSTIEDINIVCSPLDGHEFSGSHDDFTMAIGSITFDNTSTLDSTEITISGSEGNVITMNPITITVEDEKVQAWTFVDSTHYSIPLSVFESNVTEDELINAFNVSLDSSVKFGNVTSDTGSAGIHITSSNLKSDISNKFPENLNKWDGLPEHIRQYDEETSESLPQVLTLHAVHNTDEYTGADETLRQAAGIIIDPGKPKSYSDDEAEIDEEKGRVYIISNDDPSYVNNATASVPKPLLTAARICDIPTSITQLSGISGVAPQSIVDKEYVRTYVPFTVEDKNRLYNVIADNWVKPTALDAEGNPVVNSSESMNKYIFDSKEILKRVDMVDHNDFRLYVNLNPVVSSDDVEVYNIADPGSGYSENDEGLLIVGGFSFTYKVTEVDESGGVTAAAIFSNEVKDINLSNFTLSARGITVAYGTAPADPSSTGTRLQLRLVITSYESIVTRKGSIRDGLYAFVREADGLWIYTYTVFDDGLTGVWSKHTQMAKFEIDVPNESIPTTDSYLCSIMPKLEFTQVRPAIINGTNLSLKVMASSSMLNIIDTNLNPFSGNTNDYNAVDINRFYCDAILPETLDEYAGHSAEGIIETLINKKVIPYDCYVIWKWMNPMDMSDRDFVYGIIRRSLNNNMSTDEYTMLPPTDMLWKKFVHTNQSTTVVWNTPLHGPMVWVYNQNGENYEKYTIDPETRDVGVNRSKYTWKDIEIRVGNGEPLNIIDPDTNKLEWNILTNNPAQSSPPEQQDDTPVPIGCRLVTYSDWAAGTDFSSIYHNPLGSWELAFPRVESFKFVTTDPNEQSFNPVRMVCVRGSNIGDIGNITDGSGNPVNKKMLVMDDTSYGVRLKVYNSETGNWDII